MQIEFLFGFTKSNIFECVMYRRKTFVFHIFIVIYRLWARRITHFQEWNYKDYFRKFCHTQFFMFTKCLIIQCLKWLMMLKILKARQKSIILSWSLSNPSLSLSSFLWYGMPFKLTRYMNWCIIKLRRPWDANHVVVLQYRVYNAMS